MREGDNEELADTGRIKVDGVSEGMRVARHGKRPRWRQSLKTDRSVWVSERKERERMDEQKMHTKKKQGESPKMK